jgi:GNAT superfamily N-acetyltransferase
LYVVQPSPHHALRAIVLDPDEDRDSLVPRILDAVLPAGAARRVVEDASGELDLGPVGFSRYLTMTVMIRDPAPPPVAGGDAEALSLTARDPNSNSPDDAGAAPSPPSILAPGTLPPGTLPPETLTPDTLPRATLPPGRLPSETLPRESPTPDSATRLSKTAGPPTAADEFEPETADHERRQQATKKRDQKAPDPGDDRRQEVGNRRQEVSDHCCPKAEESAKDREGAVPRRDEELKIVAVEDPTRLAAAERIIAAVFPPGPVAPDWAGRVQPVCVLDIPGWQVWLGYREDVPACAAYSFHDGTSVGLYTVATLPEHRGRGLARALCSAILRAYPDSPTNLTATDRGRPLYEELGFAAVSRAVWWMPVPSGDDSGSALG